tara:strand:- start:48 stop:554 length:507 start_codon:yes stop_codon:yes gene_type:complete
LVKINLVLILFIIMNVNQQTDKLITPMKKPLSTVSDIEIYNYLINEKKLDRSKSLGILANIQAESNFKIDAVEKGDVINRGIGLFQFTFPTRKEGLLKNVPDYKTNWKGQIDYFLMEPEAKGYLNQNFKTGNEAAQFLMEKNLRPAKELRADRTKKHNEYISKFEKKF